MRLNATRRWGSLIGLRVQHVRSSMDVRPGERDGVGTGDTRRQRAPRWITKRTRNAEHLAGGSPSYGSSWA